jgi:MscS family membrane protein
MVERIGFRSTRLRASDASVVVIPNQKLVSQNLINQTTGGTLAIKLVCPVRYGIDETVLLETVDKIKQSLVEHEHIMEPVDVLVEKFNPDTMQITITYLLPFPLPEQVAIVPLKNSINVRVYSILQAVGTMGSAFPVVVVPAPSGK